MAPAEKSTKRRKTSALLLRMDPEHRAILEASAEQAEEDLQRDTPTATLGLGPYLIGLGLKDAANRGIVGGSVADPSHKRRGGKR